MVPASSSTAETRFRRATASSLRLARWLPQFGSGPARGGGPIREGSYDALEHAVEIGRADLAALLLAQGADVSSVCMCFVIETWQPEMVDLFVANGASLVRDNPIAWGLIHKIRPTLGLLKRYAPEHPELVRQADLALRHHAAEGNSKWVALTLWAGADPWARGPYWLDDTDLDDDEEDAGYRNALELALTRGHIEIPILVDGVAHTKQSDCRTEIRS